MEADIYNILDVDLIKITLFNDSNNNEKNRIILVQKLFQTKNYYYSNEIWFNLNFTHFKKNIVNDFCINYHFLKYFFDNSKKKNFYSKIILVLKKYWNK